MPDYADSREAAAEALAAELQSNDYPAVLWLIAVAAIVAGAGVVGLAVIGMVALAFLLG